MANITITIDDMDKQAISDFCAEIGMTVSGLYNVFTKQVIREQRIPFRISLGHPNRKTIKAMKEGDKMMAKYQKDPSSVKTYDNVNDLMEAMLK